MNIAFLRPIASVIQPDAMLPRNLKTYAIEPSLGIKISFNQNRFSDKNFLLYLTKPRWFRLW